jgi:hypothetical protein
MSYNINETFIIQTVDNLEPTFTACTGVYSNAILSCSGNTSILLGVGTVSVIGDIFTNNNINANNITASNYFSGSTQLSDIIDSNSLTGGTYNGQTLSLGLKNGSNISISGFTDIFVTGGTYSNGSITLINNSGGTFTINGLFTGNTDVFVTGGTYNSNTGIAIFTNNTGGTFTLSGFSTSTQFTGGTVTGATNFTGGITANTISATTYQNLPLDVFVTGGTYSNGNILFTNNTGGTFNITGLFTGNTDVFVTGGTYNPSTGVATFTNNTGGTFTINNFYTGATDVFVTGGTYSNGNILFTNNTGGTFNVTGLFTGNTDVFVTGGTYNPNTGIATFTNNTGGTFTVNNFYTGATDVFVTGGTYSNGSATFRNNTGGTFTLTGFYTGATDVFVTGGTYSNGNILFINNTGGTFNVTGLFTGNTDVFVTGGTYSNGSATFRNNTGGTFTINGFYTGATDVFVTGGTYNSNTGIANFINNTGGTFTLTGFTTQNSFNGVYLPLSGGTVTGATIFNSGLTANTINVTNYIDFNTGTTNPIAIGGRVFFDNGSKALSYYDILNNNVPIAMGQQLYTRVYNSTGSQINKGKVVTITGTSNGLPSIALAKNINTIYARRPVGLSAENIPNNSEGLIINNGILSGITLNNFSNGDILYLSDDNDGDYVSTTSSLSFNSRTNEIGYVIETGSTTGKIYVNINNEDNSLSLTSIERNILEGNVISTGVYEFTGLTKVSNTLFSIAPLKGWIVNNTYEKATLPEVINIIYSGTTGITTPYLSSSDATYVLINSASTVSLQNSFPTPQQRRQNIYLGKVVHPSRTTILNVNNTTDFDVSPMSALRDMWTSFKLINIGVIPSPNGANLNINISSGVLWGNGINWYADQLNPNSVTISGSSPATFAYRTQTGGTLGDTTTIDTTKYDVNGVVTDVPGAGAFTTQRIYLFPTGLIRIQYGQTHYPTLAKALAGIQSEVFVEYSNNRDNGILIGFLTVKDGATDLSNTNDAIFTLVSKFGEALGGTAGLSTTTLQQAYNNSPTPEIVINSTLGALTIQNGTGSPDLTTHLLEGQNTAGVITSFITAAGGFSGSSVSATTYYGLPIDVNVTGSTYSNNTFTFRNNTGGTFNVLFNTLTGLTINGNLSVTGNSNFNAVTATSVSNINYLGFNTSYTGTPNVGEISWNSDFGVPQVTMTGGNVIQKIGETVFSYVKNVDSVTLNKGDVVYIFGASGDKLSVKRASNTGDTTSSKTLGVVAETIAVNGLGYVITQGTLDGLNLGSYTEGDIVWLDSTPGGFTKTKQYAPYHLVFIGVVQRANAGNGQLYVKPQNGYELDELHNVIATGATYGDLLVYSAYNGYDVWVNTKTLNGSYTITGNTTIGGTLFSNTISATTYQNLPIDVTVTGGTYSNGNILFTNNTGGTFNVTGLFTGNTDVFVTGGTYSAGTAVFTNNTGGTFSVSGFSTSTGSGSDVFVTGGTYANGVTTFINNTGGTFTISGYQDGLAYSGESFLIVTVGSNQVTNGNNLKAAYTYATTRTPYGSALSNSNRYSIILQPGVYDIGSTTFTLSNNFIDIIGLSSDPNLAVIYSSGATVVTLGSITNYRLKNLTIENNANTTARLCIDGVNTTTRSNEEWNNIVFKYGPNAGVNTRIHNNSFTFSGRYSQIQLLTLAVGVGSTYPTDHVIMNLFSATGTTAAGTLSGSFNNIDLVCFFPNSNSIFNCITYNLFNATTLSGTFTNINYNTFTEIGAVNPVFPNRIDIGGISTTITGVFNNINVVTRHSNYPGLNIFGIAGATVSGTFKNINVNNLAQINGFGGNVNDGGFNTSSGYFENIYCFGTAVSIATETASGRFLNCIMTSSSNINRSFGGGSSGNASGEFINCTAISTGGGANASFGGNQGGFNGSNTASGRFINCMARSNSGAITSFGGFSHGSATGIFINCEATTSSGSEQRTFGGSTANGFSGTGLRINKTGQWTARVSGYVRDSEFIALGANQSAITQIQNNAKLTGIRAISTGSGLSLNATTTVSASTYLCAFNTTPFSGITNFVTTPYNVIDANI